MVELSESITFRLTEVIISNAKHIVWMQETRLEILIGYWIDCQADQTVFQRVLKAKWFFDL